MVGPENGVDTERYGDCGDRAGGDAEEGRLGDGHVVRELLKLVSTMSIERANVCLPFPKN